MKKPNTLVKLAKTYVQKGYTEKVDALGDKSFEIAMDFVRNSNFNYNYEAIRSYFFGAEKIYEKTENKNKLETLADKAYEIAQRISPTAIHRPGDPRAHCAWLLYGIATRHLKDEEKWKKANDLKWGLGGGP